MNKQTLLIQFDKHVNSPKVHQLLIRKVYTRGVHRVGYKRSTRPDKIFNKPEHDPIPERRKPDDQNPTRQ